MLLLLKLEFNRLYIFYEIHDKIVYEAKCYDHRIKLFWGDLEELDLLSFKFFSNLVVSFNYGKFISHCSTLFFSTSKNKFSKVIGLKLSNCLSEEIGLICITFRRSVLNPNIC